MPQTFRSGSLSDFRSSSQQNKKRGGLIRQQPSFCSLSEEPDGPFLFESDSLDSERSVWERSKIANQGASLHLNHRLGKAHLRILDSLSSSQELYHPIPYISSSLGFAHSLSKLPVEPLKFYSSLSENYRKPWKLLRTGLQVSTATLSWWRRHQGAGDQSKIAPFRTSLKATNVL